jgi:hypothetical protein
MRAFIVFFYTELDMKQINKSSTVDDALILFYGIWYNV